MTTATTTLGTRIRGARKERGWSQARLGEEVGTDQAAVSRVESGETTPRADTLARYARALEVSADYLLGLDATAKEVT